MTMEEAKARLTDQARGWGEYLTVVDECSFDKEGNVTARWREPEIDWDAMVADGKGLSLVK
jgi:hypothetical protein